MSDAGSAPGLAAGLSPHISDKIEYPVQRVGAVTRVQKQIEELLPNLHENRNNLDDLMIKLSTKITTFQDICNDELLKTVPEKDKSEFMEWYTSRHTAMEEFHDKIYSLIHEAQISLHQGGLKLGDSASAVGSQSGSGSSKSHASSARVKLLERRSKLKAEKAYISQFEEIENKMHKLQLEKRKLQIRQGEDECRDLEEGLQALEEGSVTGISTSKKTLAPLHEKMLNETKPSTSMAACLKRQNDIATTLLVAQQRAHLPQHQPDVFSGEDITAYIPFKLSFERMIEAHCEDEASKYYYLSQYTSKGAQQLVRSCYRSDMNVAYTNARNLLDKKYGNTYLISQAYLNKMENWPKLTYDDCKGMEELSLYLTTIVNMIETMPELDQLNSHKEMKVIVDKLPFDMMKSWRAKVTTLMENGTIPKFEHLEAFVAHQSRILNQPIFGNLKSKERDGKVKDTPILEKVKRSFAVSADSGHENAGEEGVKVGCPCCKKIGHSLDECFFFKKRNHSERINFIKERNLCFGCLRSDDHRSSECNSRLQCKICKLSHPSSLHREFRKPQECINNNDGDSENNAMAFAARASMKKEKSDGIRSPAVPVMVRSKGGKIVFTYMGLDAWATDCFISLELARILSDNLVSSDITLTTMGGKSQYVNSSILRDVVVYSLSGKDIYTIKKLFAIKNWPFEIEDAPKKSDIICYDHMRNLPFEFVSANIGILVGMNESALIKPLETVCGAPSEPYATKHFMGWAANGPIMDYTKKVDSCHRTKIKDVDNIEECLEKLFERDFVDANPIERALSYDDKLWEDRVKSTINKTPDGKFEIGLPFRSLSPSMPNNYYQALGCLKNLKKRFISNHSLHEDYNSFVQKMICKGYLELVPENEIYVQPGKVWFLVHHSVYHKRKNKIRVVFDCSLKNNGVSLNDMLLKGPDLTNNLVGVLLRFREERIAVMADVEAMFLQIKIPPEHANYMRVLWFPGGDTNLEPKQYRLTCHTFGAVSSPSVANYALQEAARAMSSRVSGESSDAILHCTYVDDLIKSVPSEEQAIALIKETRLIAASAGFNLSRVVSNARAVLSSVPNDALSEEYKEIDLGQDNLPHERTLGMTWRVNEDVWSFIVALPEKANTRRGVLATISSIYDPLGLASPAIVPARSLFQETCSRKLDWDEDLPEDMERQWVAWKSAIKSLENFRIYRCLKGNTSKIKDTQLHIYSDGSLTAYGAVAYARYDSDTEVRCCLVMSKTRSTPIGSTALRTIPRIELNAARLAVELGIKIQQQMTKFDEVHYWTDSITVLKYIHNNSARFHRFVENRVAFIRTHSAGSTWHHVPGKENPADMNSRGMKIDNFLKAENWISGPHFLAQPRGYWPKLYNIPADTDDLEVSKKTTSFAVCADNKNNPTLELLNSSSSWMKTMKFVAVYLRVRSGLKIKSWKTGNFSIDELQTAELNIWRIVQNQSFSVQMKNLRNKLPIQRADRLSRLSPFLDKTRLMRVGGRLHRSIEAYEQKHPIILPHDNHAVKIMARFNHIKFGHLGKLTLKTMLSEKYWIVKANCLSKQISRECIQCRKWHGKPAPPLMADLPPERTTGDKPAFFTTGVDFFGPFLVTRGRSRAREKRYGVVFTCLASRAVHFEVSNTLDTDSFINCLRRFLARRAGKNFISDRGTNMVGGYRELRRALNEWNSQKLENFMLQRELQWKFNKPASSSCGGIWERVIRSARKILNALIQEHPKSLDDESLHTLFCEVENIMNCRPITAISDDPADLRPLTPNHLLLNSPNAQFPPGLFDKNDTYARRRWKQIQHLANSFWLRWRKEYLRTLQERQKWKKEVPNLKLGDLVLISDVLLPRNQWCVGRIVEVNFSSDDRVRSAKVKCAKYQLGQNVPGGVHFLERPVSKLVWLMSE